MLVHAFMHLEFQRPCWRQDRAGLAVAGAREGVWPAMASPASSGGGGKHTGEPNAQHFGSLAVTDDDISKARSYILQLKVQIEVACNGTDVRACQELLDAADELQDGDVFLIGEELIARLQLHMESLTIPRPPTSKATDGRREKETADGQPEPGTAPEVEPTSLPPAPAHAAMKQLKATLRTHGAAHKLADMAQQRQTVVARVSQLLDDLESKLEARVGVEASSPLTVSAAAAMSELMIRGFANPAAHKDSRSYHPSCGSRLDGAAFRRVSLILARVISESDDPFSVLGVAWGSGRLAALWSSEENVVAQALNSPRKLCAEDALNYACLYAAGCHVPGSWVQRSRAIGLSTADFAKLCVSAEPIVSQSKMSSDDIPMQMVELLLNLIRSGDIPELAIGGAWCVQQHTTRSTLHLHCSLFCPVWAPL